MTNGWKVTAIIFIILFLLQSAFMAWAWKTGSDEINNEQTCKINICSNGPYDGFVYDSLTKTCYCYQGLDVVYQEVIR